MSLAPLFYGTSKRASIVCIEEQYSLSGEFWILVKIQGKNLLPSSMGTFEYDLLFNNCSGLSNTKVTIIAFKKFIVLLNFSKKVLDYTTFGAPLLFHRLNMEVIEQ